MDLVAVVLFLAMYYLRPQDWGSLFANLRPVQLTMILGLFSLVTRDKGVRFKDLFRTPHDWAMLFFFAWLCLTSDQPFTNFKTISNLMLFYFVIVQTLNSVKRMEIFLSWWCLFIFIVAALAVSSEYGFDPFGSYNVTHWWMKDRLVLNLWIFNNPNSLAHSVVPVIPMIYFVVIWKRPLLMKQLGTAALSLPLYCIYLTVSKGAFLSGFATMIVTLTFGRPKWVQILIAILGIGLGTGALWALPRMGELNKSKSDEAIQGRIAAYTYGYKCVTTMWAGIGYNNWMGAFYAQSHRVRVVRDRHFVHGKLVTFRRLVSERYPKAAHGSFNNMGAELGFTGLALFFGMVWCSIRTLTTCTVGSVEEERVRRALFVLMITYLVSSWMVDFGYRPTFFMFTAATAAFHRHLRGIHRLQDIEIEAERAAAVPWWEKAKEERAKLAHAPAVAAVALPAPKPVPALPDGPVAAEETEALVPESAALLRLPKGKELKPAERTLPAWMKRAAEPVGPIPLRPIPAPEDDAPKTEVMNWNKIGLIDVGMATLLTYGAVCIWGYIIRSM